MVLYHAYHAGTLNLALIHRLTVNQDKEAILMVGNEQLMGPVYKKLPALVSLGIFKKVIVCNECFGLRESTIEKCEQAITKHFNEVFSKNYIDLNKIESIYTGVDTLHSFAIYLSIVHKQYYFFEAYVNFFKEAVNRLNNSRNDFPVYVDTMLKHGAADGSSPLATRIIRRSSEPLEGAVIFDFESEIYNISEINRSKIFKFFDTPDRFNNNEPVDVLVTCSQWVLRNYPDVKQRALTIYQYIADYFASSNTNMIIKPHPLSRCSSEEYRQNFNGIFVFEKEFPSNFMPLIQGLKINNAYTICSTGALSFSNQQGKGYMVGYSFYKMYPLLPKLHYLLALYNNFRDYKFSSYGISNEFVENTKNFIFNMQSVPMSWTNVDNITDNYAVVDDMNWNKGNYCERLLKSINENTGNFIIVCINSKNDDFFAPLLFKQARDYVCIVDLVKEPTKQTIMAPMEKERIVIFAKNAKAREIIKNFEYKKELPYTGCSIKAKVLNEQETSSYICELMNKVINKKIDLCIEQITEIKKEIGNNKA